MSAEKENQEIKKATSKTGNSGNNYPGSQQQKESGFLNNTKRLKAYADTHRR